MPDSSIVMIPSTAVSTIVRILEKKGFVSYRAFGKTHEYYPIVTKDAYKKAYLNSFVKNYFSGSFQELVSFFAEDRKMTVSQLEEIGAMIREEILRQRSHDGE